MSYSFNKICRGSLLTIAMLLGSVSTGAVVLIIKHAGKALQLSKDSSKYATQRTIAQNMTFRLSKELEKIIASKGSSTQPFTYTFVNNSNPTITVRTYSETPTDSSALNIAILQPDDHSLDLNSQTSKTSLRARVTSRDQTSRNNVGRNSKIIQDTITSSSSPTATQGAGGYNLQVQKVYPDPSESKSAIYALLIQGYACDNGNPSDGSCNSSSIIGDNSIVVFKKRTCIDTRLAPFSNPNGAQLVVAADPGTDFYNLKCTCPDSKTIQADGACMLHCSAGKELSGGSCTNCASGSYSRAGDNACVLCNGCGASFGGGTCDPTQGCTSCPGGRRLSGNSCVPCDAGTWAAAGANICTLCPAGTYSFGGASSCSSCAAGTYSAEGASSCTSCSIGTWAAGGSIACQSCITTGVATCDSTTGKPVTCNNGYQKSADGNTCVVSCPSGATIGGSGDSTNVNGCNCNGSTPAWSGTPLNMCHTRCSVGSIYCEGGAYPNPNNDYYYFSGCINTCTLQGNTLLNCYFTAKGKTFYISPSSCDTSSMPITCPANSAIGNYGHHVYDEWICSSPDRLSDPACIYFNTPIADNCFCPDNGYSDGRMLLWNYSAVYNNWGCYRQDGLTGKENINCPVNSSIDGGGDLTSIAHCYCNINSGRSVWSNKFQVCHENCAKTAIKSGTSNNYYCEWPPGNGGCYDCPDTNAVPLCFNGQGGVVGFTNCELNVL